MQARSPALSLSPAPQGPPQKAVDIADGGRAALFETVLDAPAASVPATPAAADMAEDDSSPAGNDDDSEEAAACPGLDAPEPGLPPTMFPAPADAPPLEASDGDTPMESPAPHQDAAARPLAPAALPEAQATAELSLPCPAEPGASGAEAPLSRRSQPFDPLAFSAADKVNDRAGTNHAPPDPTCTDAQATGDSAPDVSSPGITPDATLPAETGQPGLSFPPEALVTADNRNVPLRMADAPVFPRPPAAAPQRPGADAIVQTRDGGVEVTLNPVELGRVTFRLGTEGDPGHLAVLLERPETLDLVRRHSDQLLRDLRIGGMADPSLDILQQDGRNHDRAPGGDRSPVRSRAADAATDPAPDPPAGRVVSLARIDIRL